MASQEAKDGCVQPEDPKADHGLTVWPPSSSLTHTPDLASRKVQLNEVALVARKAGGEGGHLDLFPVA